MTFAFIHVCIRNDEHCPTCRKYYVTCFDDLDEACDYKHLDERDLLKRGGVLWVDEWERRRNGDRYEVFEITSGRIYALNEWFISNGEREYDRCLADHGWFDNKSKQLKLEGSAEPVTHMLLHVQVDKRQDCPKNIIFTASFYKSLDNTCVAAKVFSRDIDTSRLKNLEPVWIKYGPKNGNGDHWQIIEIEPKKEIYLNSFCPQIQEGATDF